MKNSDIEIFSKFVFKINEATIINFGLKKEEPFVFATQRDLINFIHKIILVTIEESGERIKEKNPCFVSISTENLNKFKDNFKFYVENYLLKWLTEYEKSGMISDFRKSMLSYEQFSLNKISQSNTHFTKVSRNIMLNFL